MTKLILIFLLLGLQNPPPTSRVSESQPPENKTGSEQGTTSPSDAQANALATVPNNSSVSGQQRTNGTTNNTDDNSPKNWWRSPEWIMVITSGVMIFVGIGQFIMYLFQWRAMREALRLSKESSERGLRAYIAVINHDKSGGIRIPNDVYNLPETISLYIKNSGQTPAYGVTTFVKWKSFHGPDAHWPEDEPFAKGLHYAISDKDNRGSSTALGSGQVSHTVHGFDPHDDGLTIKDALEKVVRGEATIFLCAVVIYRDIYGTNHITQFCETVRYNPAETRKYVIAAYDLHNDAD